MLVSLRDLNEWVTSQEAELLGLSPVGGDEVTIRKQQVNHTKMCNENIQFLSDFFSWKVDARVGVQLFGHFSKIMMHPFLSHSLDIN